MSSYDYWMGRSHASAAAVNPPARDLVAEMEAESAVAVAASLTYKPQILDLKQRLVACRAVREALREALIQVAPDHPLVNPVANNPPLQEIGREAGETVTRWDEQI